MSSIQDRIRLTLHFKKLTASQLADIIGVQRSSISHILSGRNKPSLDLVQRIVKEFPDISFDWLINGTEKKESTPSAVEKETAPPLVKNDHKELNQIQSEENPPTYGKTKTLNQKPENLSGKKLIKLILIYDDGSFESFNQN